MHVVYKHALVAMKNCTRKSCRMHHGTIEFLLVRRFCFFFSVYLWSHPRCCILRLNTVEAFEQAAEFTGCVQLGYKSKVKPVGVTRSLNTDIRMNIQQRSFEIEKAYHGGKPMPGHDAFHLCALLDTWRRQACAASSNKLAPSLFERCTRYIGMQTQRERRKWNVIHSQTKRKDHAVKSKEKRAEKEIRDESFIIADQLRFFIRFKRYLQRGCRFPKINRFIIFTRLCHKFV